jgi:hypothetical protein
MPNIESVKNNGNNRLNFLPCERECSGLDYPEKNVNITFLYGI